jgi:ribose transport system ATP-binding protein
VAENIFLGREPRNGLGLIDYRKLINEARNVLATLAPEIDPAAPLSRLRIGAQQVVEIAKAISAEARVLIMDEPTSAITEQEAARLFRLIHELKRRGVGIIYITHKLAELPQIADKITVLRDGRLVGSRQFSDVNQDEIVRMMVGRELAVPPPTVTSTARDEGLFIRGVTLRDPRRPGDFVVRDVSLGVRFGEIVGLFGLMGAGRTELLQTIFGLHPSRSSGNVFIAGKQINIRTPRDAIRAGLAMAPEDRKAEGLVLTMSVVENCSLACLSRSTRFGILQPARELGMVERYVNRFGIRASSINERVRNLSGGNQQKVVLSKWLATDPKVLLLDEPTRGIDLNAKQEIYSVIAELARSGMAVLLVSSELPEILTVANRIVVLSEGRVTAEFKHGEATEEQIMNAALPKGYSTN